MKPPVPYQARKYQEVITDAIIETKRVNVFAGMGMGKTAATLTAIERLMLCGELLGPVLIIAPLRVANTTWPDEILKWDHLVALRVAVITGALKNRMEAINSKADIYTTNYEQLPWLVEHFGANWPFSMVVADESTKLKGYRSRQGTSRAKALAQVAHTYVDRFVCLTGTPCSNGLKDLWGANHFIDKGKSLGKSYTAFSERWFRQGYTGFSISPVAHAEAEIKKAMEPYTYTLVANDWFDLKEPIKNFIAVKLPQKAMKQYLNMEKLFFTELAKDVEVEAVNAAAKSQKCLQLANGAVYVDEDKNWEETHDVKLDALESIINESSGANVLVVYNYKHDLIRLKKRFPNAKTLDKDPRTIADWNDGKIQILFVHPASASHGISLQDGGHHLAFFSVGWNLEEHLQVIERIGPVRQLQSGYDRPVFLHYILAENTLDQVVMERLEGKKSVQESLLAALKARS